MLIIFHLATGSFLNRSLNLLQKNRPHVKNNTFVFESDQTERQSQCQNKKLDKDTEKQKKKKKK